VDTSQKSNTESERATRRFRTVEEKLAIVTEASRPGVSVAAIARKHDVNANLLFGWVRLHRKGLLETQRQARPAPLDSAQGLL